jgi:hypothetical protein
MGNPVGVRIPPSARRRLDLPASRALAEDGRRWLKGDRASADMPLARVRKLRDAQKSGGIQSANISSVNRR